MAAELRLLWIPLTGCSSSYLCFVAGSRVSVPGGRRPIESLLLDAEDAPDELVLRWSSNTQGGLEAAGAVGQDGRFTGTLLLDDGPHRLSAVVTDTASDLVEVVVSDK